MSSKTGIGRKVISIFIMKIIITIVSYLGVFFVARLMGAEAWGMVGFAVGMGGLFFQTDFGFGVAHQKRVSEGRDIGECLGAYIRIKIALTVALAGVLLLAYFIWDDILGYGYDDPMIMTVVFIILGYFIMFAISQLASQTFGGLRQSVKQQIPEMLGTIVRGPLMIVVAVMGLGVIWLGFTYLVGGLVMLAVAIFMLRNFKFKKPSRGLMKSYLVFAAPLSIYIFFSTLSLNLDKIVLQIFWNSTEVGVFFMMQKIILVLAVITSSLGPIFFPSISHYHSKGAMKFVRRLVARSERYMSMIITPMVALLIPLAAPIILIMAGKNFIAGVDTLMWLGIYGLVVAISVPHVQVVQGCGRSDLAAKVGLTVAISNIVLLILLVPRSIMGYELMGLGSTGAAIASTVSMIIGFFLSRRYSWRVAKTRTNPRIYKHWIAGFLTTAMIYMVTENLWAVARWYELGIMSVIGLGVYLGILAAIKEFTRKDWDFFMDLLNPRKMGKYVKGELRG